MDVRLAGVPDPRRLALLLGGVGNQLLQGVGLGGEGVLRIPPVFEERLIVGDDEAAFPGLDVHDEPFELVDRGERVRGHGGQPGRFAQVEDRDEQYREGTADGERQRATRAEHASGEPAGHRGLRCPGGRGHARGRRNPRVRGTIRCRAIA